MAEFDNRFDLLEAAHAAYAAGYRDMDAYTPFPVHGLADAIGKADNIVQRMVLGAGLTGCIGGFALMYWITNIVYPFNVGGKPNFSWPVYVPITFECTVLLAALTAAFGMLAINGLPQPHHPVFSVPAFERATQDRFFLCLEATDPKFTAEDAAAFLKKFHPMGVTEVENTELEK
jgi:Protein of unknown function (DUF3341)